MSQILTPPIMNGLNSTLPPVMGRPLPAGPTAVATPLPPLVQVPDTYFQLHAEAVASQGTQSEPPWNTLSFKLKSAWKRWQFDQSPSGKGSLGKLQTPQGRVDALLINLSSQKGILVDPKGQELGTLNDKGILRLHHRPGAWDIFNNPFLQPRFQDLGELGALGKRLLQLAFHRALQDNAAPYLRGFYPELNGQGTRIALLDFDEHHMKNLQSIAASPVYGIAPGATIEPHLFNKQPSSFERMRQNGGPLPTTRTQLDQMVLGDFLNDFSQIQSQLAQMVLTPQPPHMVVLALTMERLLEYSSLVYESLPRLMPQLQEAQQRGTPIDPQLAQLLGQFTQPDPKARFSAVIHYVDTLLDNSPQLKQAQQQYINLTRQAAQQGTLIIISAGNSQNQFATDLPLRPDALTNFLGQSPHVLVVGGSDNNQTPAKFEDDKLAAFSNLGTSTNPASPNNLSQPTDTPTQLTAANTATSPTSGGPDLLAPAVLLPIDAQLLGHPAERAFNNGTSLSGPWVAGILALAHQARPDVPLPAWLPLLKATSQNPDKLPQAFVGAGFLNPFTFLDTLTGKNRR